ncbi:hypothetical protein N7509_001492 [Penicillium cosmopolitanum]|uniref:Uncharacterized protein n=1 Tax=Penicillium cosmopolitanum TaxID=1131564 RepID=A0A9X0BCK0_9EURO|nr:uncharacterized protein N7509_001492 [Penicillium cosmopolitanum]KAJ5407609.1 hypothetical protein N7509_001492 [Penicillium cosmopolitanum]
MLLVGGHFDTLIIGDIPGNVIQHQHYRILTDRAQKHTVDSSKSRRKRAKRNFQGTFLLAKCTVHQRLAAARHRGPASTPSPTTDFRVFLGNIKAPTSTRFSYRRTLPLLPSLCPPHQLAHLARDQKPMPLLGTIVGLKSEMGVQNAGSDWNYDSVLMERTRLPATSKTWFRPTFSNSRTNGLRFQGTKSGLTFSPLATPFALEGITLYDGNPGPPIGKECNLVLSCRLTTVRCINNYLCTDKALASVFRNRSNFALTYVDLHSFGEVDMS